MSAAFVLTLFSLPLVDDCNVSNSIGFARSGRKARKTWTCRSICKLEMLQYYMYSILYYFNIFSTVSIFLVPNGVDCIKGGLHIPIRGDTQKRFVGLLVPVLFLISLRIWTRNNISEIVIKHSTAKKKIVFEFFFLNLSLFIFLLLPLFLCQSNNWLIQMPFEFTCKP